jgi:hypothetical protein
MVKRLVLLGLVISVTAFAVHLAACESISPKSGIGHDAMVRRRTFTITRACQESLICWSKTAAREQVEV